MLVNFCPLCSEPLTKGEHICNVDSFAREGLVRLERLLAFDAYYKNHRVNRVTDP